jgi:Bacterial tandem repeat domain 1
VVATAIAFFCFPVSGGFTLAAARAAPVASSAEVVRTSVPHDLYPVEIARFTKAGYRPVWVDGFRAARKTWFNIVFRRDDGKTAWVARNDLSGGQYQAQFDRWRKAGYRPLDLESYATADGIRYAAIFVKSAGPRWLAYDGLGEADHQSRFDQLTREGWRPVIISVAPSGGARYYTALYEKKDVGSFVSLQVLDATHYQAAMNQQSAAGRKLVYLNAYNDSTGARFTAIWYSNAVKSYARHGIAARDYSVVANTQRAKGLLTRAVTGYTDGSSVRYAAFWSK